MYAISDVFVNGPDATPATLRIEIDLVETQDGLHVSLHCHHDGTVDECLTQGWTPYRDDYDALIRIDGENLFLGPGSARSPRDLRMPRVDLFDHGPVVRRGIELDPVPRDDWIVCRR